MLNPMSRPPLTEEVLEQVKHLITDGKITVGEKLPTEHELVKMLGVSRSTIREVLITLQAQGYIEIRRGKGAFVIDKSEFDKKKFLEWFQQNEFKIQELIEARMAIEPMAAYLAAKRITEAEMSNLELIYESFVSAIKKQNLVEIVKGDELFHETVLKASRNQLLIFMYSNFIPGLNEYRSKAFSPPANPNLAIVAHKEILYALKERNGKASFEKMLKHIYESQTDIIDTATTLFSVKDLNKK